MGICSLKSRKVTEWWDIKIVARVKDRTVPRGFPG